MTAALRSVALPALKMYAAASGRQVPLSMCGLEVSVSPARFG
jgi:hypothetical protein